MDILDLLGVLWDGIKQYYRTKLGELICEVWFGDLELKGFKDGTITMATPSEIKINVIKSKYLAEIEQKFSENLGMNVKIELVFSGDTKSIQDLRDRFARAIKEEEEAEASAKAFDTVEPERLKAALPELKVGSTKPPFKLEAPTSLHTQPALPWQTTPQPITIPCLSTDPRVLAKRTCFTPLPTSLSERDPISRSFTSRARISPIR